MNKKANFWFGNAGKSKEELKEIEEEEESDEDEEEMGDDEE